MSTQITRWFLSCLIAMTACATDDGVKHVAPMYVGDAQCSSCGIAVVEMGLIGNDSLMPTLDARLATDGDSIIAVAPLQGRGAVGVFSLTGTARRVVPLPDGWSAVSALEFSHGGLLVAMSEQRTRVVFLASPGGAVQDVPVPRNTHRFLITENGMIVNAQVQTAEGLGFPLHLLSPTGLVKLSFGANDETVIPREENLWRRRLAASRSGAVWSANPDTYRLESWSARGLLLRQLERKSPWWDSAAAGGDAAQFAIEKPKAEVIAIWEDSTGLLWTQLKVAAREWHPLSAEELARRHDAPFRLSEYDELFDTVIEVIDPARGKLLASLRLPGAVGLLLRGNLFAKWVQTGPQSYSLRLSRLSLDRADRLEE